MKRLALIGRNINYSLSPLVHNAIFDALGIEAEYTLCDIEPNELSIDNPKIKNLDGFNVTQPYKHDIIPHLTKNCSSFDAVNTVVRNGDKLYGYNTDCNGFEEVIKDYFVSLKGHDVLVYGAGGMGSVACQVLKSLKANVYIFNRTIEKANALKDRLGINVASKKMNISPTLIVNCSSQALFENGNVDFVEADYSKLMLAFDTIYFDTEFLKKAKATNPDCIIENGLRMLILQAIHADELFLNTSINNKKELAQKVQKIVQNKIREQKK